MPRIGDGGERLDQPIGAIQGQTIRLTAAVAIGGDLPALVESLTASDRERRALESRLAALDRPVPTLDQALETRLRRAAEEWRGVLGRQVGLARQIMTKLLAGRVTFEPEDRHGLPGFRFRAVGTLAKLVTGLVPGEWIGSLRVLASPTGFEPVFWP
jgi:hypothetical protein